MMDEPISADAGGVEAAYTLALRPGTRLDGRYVVLRLLAGTSDFALTYLAHDSRDDIAVVLKELLPRGLVGRSGEGALRAHSPDAEREFGRVLRRFVREGEILIDLRHPALPGALDVVEDHETAYLVMPRHDALRLSEHLPSVGGRLAMGEAVSFVDGLLGALATLHGEGILHREVSSSTVHIRQDGSPLLLGLGAWRHVPGRNREPVAGFDPIEQYGGRDVGPWSDVYGAAAVLYYMATGTTPVSAIERAGGAQLRSPGAWGADVSPPMATAIVRGLSLTPEGRPHSAAELRRHLADAAAMAAEPTLPRVIGGLPSELAAQAGAGNAGYRDDEQTAVPFTLNSFGVVVPRDDGGMERTLRRVVDVAARLTRRRPAERRDDPAVVDAAPAPAVDISPDATLDQPPAAAGRRLDPVYDAEHARAVPVEDARPELDTALMAMASEGTSVVPASEPTAVVLSPTHEAPIVAETEQAAEVTASASRVLMPTRRRRMPLILAAAVLGLAGVAAAVALPTALRARAARDSGARRAAARQTASPSPTAAVPLALASRAAEIDSARIVLQGSAIPSKASATSGSPPAKAAPTRTSSSGEVAASLPNVPKIAAPEFTLPATTGAPQLIAADLVVDARSRVSVAGEQADQGNYAAARQTLAGALARLDSAAARASDTESLRGVRREIEAAQKRNSEACGAESELRRRHGQTPLSCP